MSSYNDKKVHERLMVGFQVLVVIAVLASVFLLNYLLFFVAVALAILVYVFTRVRMKQVVLEPPQAETRSQPQPKPAPQQMLEQPPQPQPPQAQPVVQPQPELPSQLRLVGTGAMYPAEQRPPPMQPTAPPLPMHVPTLYNTDHDPHSNIFEPLGSQMTRQMRTRGYEAPVTVDAFEAHLRQVAATPGLFRNTRYEQDVPGQDEGC